MWQARLSELAFDDAELSSILEVVDSEWITSGPRTLAFEKAFAEQAQATDAIAVANGTAALFLALKAAGVGPGDEVLCPSMTFVATAAAVVHCGAVPVFVDIQGLVNPTLDVTDAKSKITPRTRAILPVHYAGIPADMDRLAALASGHGLLLIEDAAHAPGASFAGRVCGSWGAAGCFSFFGNKNITTAEGGMITTSNPDIASRLRLLRSHGMTVTSWDREKGRPSHYDVLEIGYNLRFDDIRAAIGLAQLKKLPEINRRRRELAALYNARFLESGLDVILPFSEIPDFKKPAHHLYPVVFGSMAERDAVARFLEGEGIQTSLHYTPIHRLTAFRKLDAQVRLPVTEDFSSRELTLPLYPSLTDAQVDTIVSAVVRCYEDKKREPYIQHSMATLPGAAGTRADALAH
jgi:dTDP-4-amino-4,6-dideoxygalactose transaminase